MTLFSKSLLTATAGAIVLAFSAATASAAIACVGNVCWHAKERYEYPRESKVIIREDSWKPEANAKITWREHEGRGYWRDDKWVTW
jgi:hypothetical protein